MITSVHEALREAVTEVFEDWADDGSRHVFWDHHLGFSMFHEPDCPDGVECERNCSGGHDSCCCDHEVSSAVSLQLSLQVSEPEERLCVWGQTIKFDHVFTRSLHDLLTQVREMFENHIGVLSVDVDSLISELLDAPMTVIRPDKDE